MSTDGTTTRATTTTTTTADGGAHAGAEGDWRAGVRRSGPKQLLVLALTAAVVVLGAWLLGNRTESARSGATTAGGAQAVQVTGPQEGPAPEVGMAPQTFAATTITGEKVDLAALKGRPVWLTFGASWCTACRAEAPDLEAVYQANKAKGFEVVAVNMQESAADVQAFAGRAGLTFPQVADPQTTLASRYRVVGLPSHFLIGRDGVLRQVHVGAMTRPAMEKAVAEISR